MATVAKPTSVRAFARHLGVSHTAVRKAIDSGRLAGSVVWLDGKPKIANVELAETEWHGGRRPQATDEPDADADEGSGYPAHRARREAAQADLAELKLRERRGELVVAEEVAREWADQVVAVKTRLLGVPTRLRQQLPSVSSAVAGMVEDLIREVLEELADAR